MTNPVLCEHTPQSPGVMAAKGFSLCVAEELESPIPKLATMLGYFEQKTQGERLPCRADIVPAEITQALPEVAILSLGYDEGALVDIVVQLMGTTLTDYYGEHTGRSISAFGDTGIADRIFAACTYCLAQRQAVVSSAEALSEERPYMRVRALMVPLSEDGTHIDRIFAYVLLRRKSLGG